MASVLQFCADIAGNGTESIGDGATAYWNPAGPVHFDLPKNSNVQGTGLGSAVAYASLPTNVVAGTMRIPRTERCSR